VTGVEVHRVQLATRGRHLGPRHGRPVPGYHRWRSGVDDGEPHDLAGHLGDEDRRCVGSLQVCTPHLDPILGAQPVEVDVGHHPAVRVLPGPHVEASHRVGVGRDGIADHQLVVGHRLGMHAAASGRTPISPAVRA
jgi:hypothetical protein